MGGCGSGRHTRFASKTDEFQSIDMTDFKSEWFENGRTGTMRWSRGGQETGSVGYHLSDDAMVLKYSVGEGEDRLRVNERFLLEFTEQPFGGYRRWFRCPSCGRRVRVLYGGRYFRCRHCYGAVYDSQYDRFPMQGIGRAHRVRRKLGGDPGLGYCFPSKPKGMHWRTYRRLMDEDNAAMNRVERALMGYW